MYRSHVRPAEHRLFSTNTHGKPTYFPPYARALVSRSGLLNEAVVELLRHAQSYGNASGDRGFVNFVVVSKSPIFCVRLPFAARDVQTICGDGPGRDPHPSGAPQTRPRKGSRLRLRSHEPSAPYLRLFLLGGKGRRSSAQQQPQQQQHIPLGSCAVKTEQINKSNIMHPPSSHLFPTGDPPHPTFRGGV